MTSAGLMSIGSGAGGMNQLTRSLVQYAIATPQIPPATASSALSVSSCRTSRRRLAPSVRRTAVSRWRPGGARQQQVADIGARDQQHDPGDAELDAHQRRDRRAAAVGERHSS